MNESLRLQALKQNNPSPSYPVEKITVESESQYEYGESYSSVIVRGYRTENDREFATRCELLDKQEAKVKKLAADALLKKEKLKREKELLEVDPEYQKYLALKKKFKS